MFYLKLSVIKHARLGSIRLLILIFTHTAMHEVYRLIRIVLVIVQLVLLTMLALHELEHETLELLFHGIQWNRIVASFLDLLSRRFKIIGMLACFLFERPHVLLGHIDVLDTSVGRCRRDLIKDIENILMKLGHIINSLLHFLLLSIKARRRAIILLDALSQLNIFHLLTELVNVAVDTFIEGGLCLQQFLANLCFPLRHYR